MPPISKLLARISIPFEWTPKRRLVRQLRFTLKMPDFFLAPYNQPVVTENQSVLLVLARVLFIWIAITILLHNIFIVPAQFDKKAY